MIKIFYKSTNDGLWKEYQSSNPRQLKQSLKRLFNSLEISVSMYIYSIFILFCGIVFISQEEVNAMDNSVALENFKLRMCPLNQSPMSGSIPAEPLIRNGL